MNEVKGSKCLICGNEPKKEMITCKELQAIARACQRSARRYSSIGKHVNKLPNDLDFIAVVDGVEKLIKKQGCKKPKGFGYDNSIAELKQ